MGMPTIQRRMHCIWSSLNLVIPNVIAAGCPCRSGSMMMYKTGNPTGASVLLVSYMLCGGTTCFHTTSPSLRERYCAVLRVGWERALTVID